MAARRTKLQNEVLSRLRDCSLREDYLEYLPNGTMKLKYHHIPDLSEIEDADSFDEFVEGLGLEFKTKIKVTPLSELPGRLVYIPPEPGPIPPPVRMRSKWLSETVVGIARNMVQNPKRRVELAPILADALQEAGCDQDILLADLRKPKPVLIGWVLSNIKNKVKVPLHEPYFPKEQTNENQEVQS